MQLLLGTILLQAGSNQSSSAFFALIFLGIRIIGAVYCGDKATKLNRNVAGWAVFGLFFPIIAMILISSLKAKIIWHNQQKENED